MASKTFHEVKAWQKAHQFVLAFYKTKKLFPDDEKYALVPQFQRAAISIAANIAEGYKKVSKADKLRFFNIAQGSLEECRYYINYYGDKSIVEGQQAYGRYVEEKGYTRSTIEAQIEDPLYIPSDMLEIEEIHYFLGSDNTLKIEYAGKNGEGSGYEIVETETLLPTDIVFNLVYD